MPLTTEQALERAEYFRQLLIRQAGAQSDDKRRCHELAAAGASLDTRNRHDAQFKMACEVIDDLVLAVKPPKEAT